MQTLEEMIREAQADEDATMRMMAGVCLLGALMVLGVLASIMVAIWRGLL